MTRLGAHVQMCSVLILTSVHAHANKFETTVATAIPRRPAIVLRTKSALKLCPALRVIIARTGSSNQYSGTWEDAEKKNPSKLHLINV